MMVLLLASVFVVATCGLIYELVAGALASYLLGDSVTQFSTVIGTYLFAMGVGSYLSKFVRHKHLQTFIKVELVVGVVGGMSAALLMAAFAHAAFFQLLLYLIVFVIGTGVGLEIPLLMYILKNELQFSDLVSRVLSFDYIGALIASVSFPLFLLPHLGLVRTALLFGILNVAVALVAIVTMLPSHDRSVLPLRFCAFGALGFLTLAFVFGDQFYEYAEASYYPDRVIYSAHTPYQRIVLTRGGDATRLYLNGHLQFDSRDEYRYHEALVHLPAAYARDRSKVLVIGGGDGLALRELLKYGDVQEVTLVDLDPAMTTLFQKSPLLEELNHGSLRSDKVTVIHQDAFVWLRSPSKRYGLVVIDLPDPTSYSLGKLYTTTFYALVGNALTDDGVMVVQATSPMMARSSYWCIVSTIEAAGFVTLPYHAYVPSFGEWGFVAASKQLLLRSHELPSDLRYLDEKALSAVTTFAQDMSRVTTTINRLNNQALVGYYEKEWARYGL